MNKNNWPITDNSLYIALFSIILLIFVIVVISFIQNIGKAVNRPAAGRSSTVEINPYVNTVDKGNEGTDSETSGQNLNSGGESGLIADAFSITKNTDQDADGAASGQNSESANIQLILEIFAIILITLVLAFIIISHVLIQKSIEGSLNDFIKEREDISSRDISYSIDEIMALLQTISRELQNLSAVISNDCPYQVKISDNRHSDKKLPIKYFSGSIDSYNTEDTYPWLDITEPMPLTKETHIR